PGGHCPGELPTPLPRRWGRGTGGTRQPVPSSAPRQRASDRLRRYRASQPLSCPESSLYRSLAQSLYWPSIPSLDSLSRQSCRLPAKSARTPARRTAHQRRSARSPSSASPHTPTSVQVGADLPLQVVDKGMGLLVWRAPVEAALRVRHISVERRDRRVDQLGHAAPLLIVA